MESTLPDKIQNFLQELGKGFCFEGRQNALSVTIRVILCTEKEDIIVRYSVLAENEQLFTSKYCLHLPKEELRQLIEQGRGIFELDNLKGK